MGASSQFPEFLNYETQILMLAVCLIKMNNCKFKWSFKVKPVLREDYKLVLKTYYNLMQVILQYVRPSLSYHLSLRSVLKTGFTVSLNRLLKYKPKKLL